MELLLIIIVIAMASFNLRRVKIKPNDYPPIELPKSKKPDIVPKGQYPPRHLNH